MGQVWRSYSLTMTCDPQLQMAKQGLSGGSGPEETLLGAGRGRIQAAGLHTRPHCRPLPASGASVPTWVDSTGRTGLQSGCTHKVTAGNGAHKGLPGAGNHGQPGDRNGAPASRSLAPSAPWPEPPPSPRPLLWPLSFAGPRISAKPPAGGGWAQPLLARGGILRGPRL